ncbi:MAG: NAD+ synthase [Methylococcaceae bacterium]|nr:NAD+ synthase [Methylococcaceae bacterium]MCI0667992.1 NAD+ synthase [Methylococcaceae bacterium]MCI0732806.1 NAD+ synthase [Methylococcaceae bacterium]
MKLGVAIAQLNLVVGDIDGNRDRILKAAETARDELLADVVVLPELSISGYPPEDLLLRPDFIAKCRSALDELAGKSQGICLVVGFPEKAGERLFNSAAVLGSGKIRAVYRKCQLPNYGVFDEKRYFAPGTEPCLFQIRGVHLALTICEDVWTVGAVERSSALGAQLILNLNASPFHARKIREREAVLRERIRTSRVPIVYVNLIGGQDELVFDGASFAIDARGEVFRRAPEFEESIELVEFRVEKSLLPVPGRSAPEYAEVSSEYKALVLGIRDYVRKNGFQGALLGLSGGIDSALTLALAADALGSERVEVVLMPSRYTASMSNEDAAAEARLLGVQSHVIPIEPAVGAFTAMLEETFRGLPRDTTEENIQARCRGLVLMAISNKKRKLLLTTGNKSEMSVGYATLYGDMAGGFAPLKDVPKMLVYRLAEYRNSISEVIPRRVIERPPSAELAPNQVDQDSLPPYPVLDAILERYVERDRSIEEMIAEGFDSADVSRVVALVNNNEYKRRQAPPGVRITPRAFGRDRRYPMTSGFRPL